MTWTTTAYCTLPDVKLALDPSLGTTDDAFITGLIPQAQSDIDREIGYSFQQDGTTSSPATRLYDGRGEETLWIDDLVSLYTTSVGCTPPATTCGGVFETVMTAYLAPSGMWVPGNTTIYDITNDIILKPNNYAANNIPARKMVRQSGSSFIEGTQNYKVLGIFGQPQLPGQVYPGVPNDITRATIRLSVHYYKMRDTNYSDMLQEQGGIRERYTKQWPADVVEIVNKYRHRVFVSR